MGAVKSLTMLPNKIKEGEYTWHPKTINDYDALVKQLRHVIENKDIRLMVISKSEEAMRRENELLYDRINGKKNLWTILE